ncbi:MAG: hypothetical protein A3B79_03045 [Deltaproteobacteria bacterium RIFCSPHIGHO2_02_FULL_50_15]|nr:MAG: hypothetical protein A3B79_03045 [Deltaproteobacteria bacterium RIFCSPHIGHO2_02_FULL_50_15]
MLYMFSRLLKPPNHSFLLLGPRGTGKSTWIREHFPDIPTYDLLNTAEALRLSKEPHLLFNELQGLKKESWAIIDEVQKVPALLDEVHRLMETKSIKFVLCGSSARKLKRGGANLLAGRARTVQLFPLVSPEINDDVKLPDYFLFGSLPLSITDHDPKSYLKSYAETYLQEEIKGEAATRNIGAFGRFLEVAARQNGQITNISNIARDAQVARQTVQGYFDILVDTLLGYWLQPWKLKRTTKQVAHPKFYFFDSGIVRSLSGRLPYPPTQEEMGPLIETCILNEVRAYLSYSRLHYPLYFWSSHDGVEVDLFCETQKGFTAIEIKAAPRWDNKFNRGLQRIQEEIGRTKISCFGIYTGSREATFNQIQVLPVLDFLKRLWEGNIIY